MSTTRDLDRILDAWLAEGPDHVSDRVFDGAVARLPRQPQAPGWASRWRSRPMSTSSRLVAAAVVAVALTGAGLLLLRPASFIGPPGATPAPTPSPTSSAGTEAQPLPAAGPVSPGRYFIVKGSQSFATFSFTMPAGWVAQNGGLVKNLDVEGAEVGWGPAVVDSVFAEPCGVNATTPVGPSAADLIGALAALPDLDVSASLGVTVGGYAGQSVELTLPSGVDTDTCDPPIGLQVWLDRSSDYLLVGEAQPAIVVAADVPGGRFVIASSRRDTTPAADIAELDAIFGSIRFED